MDEIRKNQIIHIELRDKTRLEGIVLDFVHDRISVLIAYESLNDAKKIKELDCVLANVHTHVGLKRMFCHVISELNPKNNCIIIENNDSIPCEQKRQFARVVSNMTFRIKKENLSEYYDCHCIDLSAASMAFSCNDATFEIGEKVDLILPHTEFEKQIACKGRVSKIMPKGTVIMFEDLSIQDENKIVKYVFKLIAQK